MNTDEALTVIRRMVAMFPAIGKYARENSADPLITTRHWVDALREFEQVEAEIVLTMWFRGDDIPGGGATIAEPIRKLRQDIRNKRLSDEVDRKAMAQSIQYRAARDRRASFIETAQLDPGTAQAFRDYEHVWKRYEAARIIRDIPQDDWTPHMAITVDYGRQFGLIETVDDFEAEKNKALGAVS